VKNSGHFIQLDQPHLVVDAIRNVVESARKQSAHAILPTGLSLGGGEAHAHY
jgi:hypothetical protein